jgi:hypothetical protein
MPLTSVAITVVAATTLSFTLVVNDRRHRQEHVHPGPELHHAHPIAGADLVALLDPADDSPRQDPDDLTEHHRLAAWSTVTSVNSLRSPCLSLECWHKTAGVVRHLSQFCSADRHPVDVHVHRRQEDADLLPTEAGNDGSSTGPAASPGRLPVDSTASSGASIDGVQGRGRRKEERVSPSRMRP